MGGDCEKDLDLDLDLDFDYKPPQAEEEEEEEEEEERKKKEEIKSSSSSSSSSHASDHNDDHHATNIIETLVGDLQNLSLKGNENNNHNHNQIDDNNNPDASDQEDPVTSTNETLEGRELQNHLIISSEEGSGGETLEGGEFQNHHLVSSEGEGVETRMISQISTNLVRFFKKEKNDHKPVASDDHDCSTITTTTTSTIETTLDGGELQSSEEGKEENQRDHKTDDDIKTQTLDGELHNLSSEWNGTPNDHPTTTIETLDGELHNPEVETNPSSEWDKLHNPEVEANPSSEWDDGWDGTQKDNPEVEWVDGTQKDKPEVEKRRTFQYPLRPEEPDCVFYLRTGSCRYGFHCKFNHPPRKKNQLKASSHLSDSSVQRLEPITAIEVVKEKEREREDYKEWTGKIECKYYRTPGGCKFGKACRYYHPQEKNVVDPPTEFNFLGLPIRPGEKKCSFFMRTGSCKFATSCRFHHPDPTDAVESDPLSGYHDAESVELHSESSPQPHVTSWSLPGTYNETAPYMDTSSSYPTGMVSPYNETAPYMDTSSSYPTGMVSPYNETAPYMDTSSSYPTGMVSPSQAHHNREWNGYQVPVRYSPEGNRNPQSASLMNHSTRKANNSMHQQQMVVDEFPERPGQHECQYYMKHGDCKYRSACRFHHPKNYSTNSPALSSIGLPLRPDQLICSNYSRFGICKYGPACKYDHPAQAS